MRMLDKTRNLLKLYLHMAGVSEVPEVYHLWACLSLIAASISDRVWFEKFPGDKMRPNFYVILLGPSGLGKGAAIGRALKIARELPGVAPYQGKLTGAYLADELKARSLSKKRTEVGGTILNTPCIYLATPELSMSLGEKMQAQDFIKRVTEWWEGGEYPFQEGTRTMGGITLKSPIINWLAGTTVEWLNESVPMSAIESGFFARAVAIEAQYDLAYRIPVPRFPKDYEEVRHYIVRRLLALRRIEGRMTMTREAREIQDRWYMTRPVPSDPKLIPSWKRADDLVLKLAMVLSVADSSKMVIKSRHIQQAQFLVSEVHKAIPLLIKHAALGPYMNHLIIVEETIKQFGTIKHTPLLRRISHKGVNAPQLREALGILVGRGDVKVSRSAKHGDVYHWIRNTQTV